MRTQALTLLKKVEDALTEAKLTLVKGGRGKNARSSNARSPNAPPTPNDPAPKDGEWGHMTARGKDGIELSFDEVRDGGNNIVAYHLYIRAKSGGKSKAFYISKSDWKYFLKYLSDVDRKLMVIYAENDEIEYD